MPRLRIHLNGAEIKTIELNAAETYVAGRAVGCEIPLGEHPGISRQHFRLLLINGQWTIQSMSKFGEVQFNGSPVSETSLESGAMFRVPPYDFYFNDDAEARQEPVSQAEIVGVAKYGEHASTPNALAPYTGQPAALATGSEDEFEGNEEKTMVGRLEMVPYVKIVDSASAAEDTFRLEGNLWIAGREAECEILLNDLKASRRQFELACSPKGYSITDLGSSNGTLLNGSQLVANEPTPVRSGDVISVGGISIHFELRDANFKSKLIVIRQDVLQNPPMILPQASGGEAISYPAYYDGPGGVVPLDPNGPQGMWPGPYGAGHAPSPKRGLDLSQPRTKILLAVVVAIFAVAIFQGSGESGPKGEANVPADPKGLAFHRLNEPQKKFIKDTYELAYTLFMQQKFDLAAGQLVKIHEMLPEGYEESYKIAEDIQQIKKDQEAIVAIKLERERIEQNKRVVRETVIKCQGVASRSMSVDEIQGCIAGAITLDPENEELRGLVIQVQARIEAEKIKRINQANYAALLGQRKRLWNEAVAFDSKGDPLAVIEKYDRVVASRLPDPEGTEAKARARIAEIKRTMSVEIERGVSEAQQLFDSDKLKEAHAALERVKKIDPGNPRIVELGTRIVTELNNRMKSIYEDSILEEGLGNVDAAKEKWKKILEIDRPGGEYFRRAKSKLRQYGA